MLTSELKNRIKTYLGFNGGVEAADEIISSCFSRLVPECSFRYTYATFDDFPAFLRVPPYADFLSGCRRVAVVVTTLGSGADALIRYLTRTDMTASLVTDACASAYLETLADEFEEREFCGERTYRFCPGYGGSDIGDVGKIFDILPPSRTGVSRTTSGYMTPSKSMAGIVGLGRRAEKTCADCYLAAKCVLKKEGRTCYSERK